MKQAQGRWNHGLWYVNHYNKFPRKTRPVMSIFALQVWNDWLTFFFFLSIHSRMPRVIQSLIELLPPKSREFLFLHGLKRESNFPSPRNRPTPLPSRWPISGTTKVSSASSSMMIRLLFQTKMVFWKWLFRNRNSRAVLSPGPIMDLLQKTWRLRCWMMKTTM